MIKQFDKTSCRVLNNEMMAAMEAVAKKHGLKVECRGGRFDSTSFTPKFTVSIPSAHVGVSATAKEVESWNHYAQGYGLKPEWLGQSYMSSNAGPLKITGLNTRKRAYPVVAEDAQGRRYALRTESVISVMGRVVVGQIVPNARDFKDEFLKLSCALSPENLTCDGELPHYQVKIRRAALESQWRALEAKVGRKVTESEVFSW